jgi:glycerate kinase
MAQPVNDVLGPHVKRGILSVPVGSGLPGWSLDSKFQVREGAANNLPDVNAMRTAQEICSLAESLTEDHLLIVLVSGQYLP